MVIHMWLDMRENKNEIIFAKNGDGSGWTNTMNVNKATDYKLAIGMFGDVKQIELISFDIQYV